MRTVLPILAFVLAALICPGICEAAGDSARLERRAQLVRELLEEGAAAEAIFEAAALVAETPAATNALADTSAERALLSGTREGVAEAFRIAHSALATQVDMCRGSWTEKDLADAKACVDAIAPTKPRRGPGTWLAAGVVGFYRLFVGPAIGARCVLEPSCSRYYLEASRKHGILGVPMVADRFVREPVESNSDRLIRKPNGSWRHPDPVSAHDWWFSEEAK